MDIRVVQATATIIPTLLIAAVFTTKIYEKAPAWQGQRLRLGFIISLLSVALVGEMAAINLLANTTTTNPINTNLASVAIGAVFFELILLSAYIVAEVATQSNSRKTTIICWVCLAPAVIVAALIFASINFG